VAAPCRAQCAAEGRAGRAVRVGRRRLEIGAGPDLPLPGGLVAVVLERRQPAVGALEHVEAPPEERRAQRAGREELRGEREAGPRVPIQIARSLEQRVAEPPQQAIEPHGHPAEPADERGIDVERPGGQHLGVAWTTRLRPVHEEALERSAQLAALTCSPL
jgi:hypothetical protein